MRFSLMLVVAALIFSTSSFGQQHPGKMNPQNTGNRSTGMGRTGETEDKLKRPDAAKPAQQDPNASTEPGRTRAPR